MRFRYQDVSRIPKPLESGVVYVNQEFELGALLCACGCRHRVDLLVPDGHRVTDEGGFATVRPSVGALDSSCKSHYFITKGNIEWLPSFTDGQVERIMHTQIQRHLKASRSQVPWYVRVWNWLVSVVS